MNFLNERSCVLVKEIMEEGTVPLPSFRDDKIGYKMMVRQGGWRGRGEGWDKGNPRVMPNIHRRAQTN